MFAVRYYPASMVLFKGRSTLTNITYFVQFVSEAPDKRLEVDVTFTDFTKAFDNVHHGIILKKLGQFGICEELIHLVCPIA